jgi:diguanylate cyclase (GGDEF)-like protein/PAS domain S-box-containing protein
MMKEKTTPGALIIGLDRDCRLFFANQEILTVLGYSQEELIGQDWFDMVVLQTSRDVLRRETQKIFDGDTATFCRTDKSEVYTKDGKYRKILWSYHLQRADDGNVTGMIGIGHDVTEATLSELRLHTLFGFEKIIDKVASFEEAIPHFLKVIGESVGWDFGEMWCYKEEEQLLHWRNCWYRENRDLEYFQQISEKMVIPKGKGIPGWIVANRISVWIEEVADFCDSLRKDVAQRVGLHSVFGIPIRAGKAIVGVIIFLTRDIRPADDKMLAMLDAIGLHIGTLYRRKQAEEQLGLWAEIFRNSGEAILVTDPGGKIVAANEAFEKMSGYSAREVIGKNPRILKSDIHGEVFFRDMWQMLLTGGFWQGEIWDKRKNGEIYPKWSTINRIKNSKGEITHYIAAYTDLSEKKAAAEQIYFLANYDLLTGLPNRTQLFERMSAALTRAGREKGKLAVFCLDLDQFKIINDSLGHETGEILLKETAKRIQECAQEADTVSRTGGDEFIVLFTDFKDAGELAHIAKRIGECIQYPIRIHDKELVITASIGISVYPADGDNLESLFKNADTAMYQAKKNGRNRYQFFTANLHQNIARRLSLENSLRRALVREEFVLYYQPQIDIVNHAVIGVEALIRWQDTKKGLVFPGQFISIAEDSGLIVPISHWVIKEACRQRHLWNAAGIPCLTIAVNVSAVQFRQNDFSGQMMRMIREKGLEPSQFELEITESVVIGDGEAALQELEKLKTHGFQLSIDDFGTGYSSLGYLSRFPVDKLKIDQSFIRSMLTSATDMAIVESILALSKSLNMQVIAEGVETEAQLLKLRERACGQVQGYYFAKPMTGSHFIDWWRAWNSSENAHL